MEGGEIRKARNAQSAITRGLEMACNWIRTPVKKMWLKMFQ